MLKVTLVWRDYNSKDAEHGFNAGAVTERAGADSVVFTMASALSPLSDAVIVAANARQELSVAGTVAGPNSQVHRVSVVFFNNDGVLSGLRIPSGTLAGYAIPDGPYGDTRLTREDAPPALVSQMDAIGSVVFNPDYNQAIGEFLMVVVGAVI